MSAHLAPSSRSALALWLVHKAAAVSLIIGALAKL